MKRPLIGVTTSSRFTPSWPFLALSVWLAGGRAKRITPRTERVDLDALDGLVIGGGDDIGAELYGGRPVLNARIDPERDEMELSLLDRFWRSMTPILGICRGAQIMNVFRGGTLHGNIHAVYLAAPKMRTVLPRKRVAIQENATLREVTGASELTVNSLHHQSVDELGADLSISARDESGVVQGVEVAGDPFRVGVQWHPEFLPHHRAHRSLFSALVRAGRSARCANQ